MVLATKKNCQRVLAASLRVVSAMTGNPPLLSYFPNFHGQRSGGDKILVFDTRSKVVSAMERIRSENLYTISFTRNEL